MSDQETDKAVELKSCRFCKSDNVYAWEEPERPLCGVSCRKCKTSVTNTSPELALKAWNTRDTQAVKEALEKVREKISIAMCGKPISDIYAIIDTALKEGENKG